jgi:SAM-dependent methyltransferase
MANKPDFWNRVADRYARSPIKDEATYRHKLEATQALMRADMRVLEFGCGTGGTAIHHAPHVAEYRAMDISERMIEIARAKDGADRVKFEVVDFDDLPLDPASLDMVLGLSILHLLQDPAATISRVHSALKPGGFFVSSTACVGAMPLLRVIAPIGQFFGKIPHLSYFTEDGLRDMIRGAGFEIVEDWQPKKRDALFIVARKPG